MVRTAQKTLYATDLHLHMLAGVNYTPQTNTTLNEKFMLNVDAVSGNKYPTLKYFCIGIGGSSPIQGDGFYVSSEHSPLDAALFQHLPFIIRPVKSDLTENERTNYRLRVLTTITGVQYACYYLKVLPTMDIPSYFNTIETVTPKDTTKLPYSTISVFDTNIPELLSPTPRNRNIDINKINSISKITKTGKITLEFTENDLNEIKNSMKILGLSSSSIREIGLCCGHDLATNLGTEAIHVQIMFHVGIDIPLTIKLNTETSIKRFIELGGEEPLVR